MKSALVFLVLSSSTAFAQSAKSDGRLSVVELFTSEGCSSCPSADDWLNSSFPRDGAVAIAYHVDYWNQLGWPDPFSDASYTERQRVMAERDRTHVYTPEVAIDGHELSRGNLDAALKRRTPSSVRVSLDVTRTGSTLHLQATSSDPALVLRAVVVENGLVVAVPRGENGGRTLKHDHVARRVVEGSAGTLDTQVPLGTSWKRDALGVVAYVQDRATGDIRQAAFVPRIQ